MTVSSYAIAKLSQTLPLRILSVFAERAVKETQYTIRAVYVVGSSVAELVRGEHSPETDIDVVFFTEEDIPRGERILPVEDLRKLIGWLEAKFKTQIGCYSNGVPVMQEGEVVLDAVPARMSDVANEFPHVVIDMCNRDNIHVVGQRVLDPLMNFALSPELVVRRMRLTENYLEREVANARYSEHFVVYIIKCFTFAAELATNFRLRVTNAADPLHALYGIGNDELRCTVKEALDASRVNDIPKLLSLLKHFHTVLATLLRSGGFLTVQSREYG